MISAFADAVRWTWTGGYNIISGPLADIGLLGIFGLAYRRLKCHITGCHRIGIHHVTGTPYITCRRHHPTVGTTVTTDHVQAAHQKANPRTHLHFRQTLIPSGPKVTRTPETRP